MEIGETTSTVISFYAFNNIKYDIAKQVTGTGKNSITHVSVGSLILIRSLTDFRLWK